MSNEVKMDSMTFSSAPKAFQSIENAYRKQSVSLFLKSLEFYASSIELSEDGKMGRIYANPSQSGQDRTKRKKKQAKVKGMVCTIRGRGEDFQTTS